jgi:predicted PurR-regulated permease PerM
MSGRLVGMAAEGFGTGIALSLANVSMAALLGLLSGIPAFLPNSSIISGVLIILVGFSAGWRSPIRSWE